MINCLLLVNYVGPCQSDNTKLCDRFIANLPPSLIPVADQMCKNYELRGEILAGLVSDLGLHSQGTGLHQTITPHPVTDRRML